jgi:hypothetical protein
MRFRGSRLFPKYLTFIDDDLIQKMFSEMLAIYPMKICSEREREKGGQGRPMNKVSYLKEKVSDNIVSSDDANSGCNRILSIYPSCHFFLHVVCYFG